jgi:hypothetical protein
MDKLEYITDIHFDMGAVPMTIDPKLDTILLIAGDTCEINTLKTTGGLANLKRICAAYKQVYAICGNHEFYGNYINTGHDHYRQLTKTIPNFTVLENETVDIGDYRLAAATLWTDFKKEDPEIMHICNRMMNDYVYIFIEDTTGAYGPKKAIKPFYTAALHRDALAFLEAAIEQTHKPLIVMTHHAPLMEHCNDQRYGQGWELINYAYATDLAHLVRNPKIAGWIHGHTHDKKLTWFEGTPVQTHARGYHRYDFETAKVVLRGDTVWNPTNLDHLEGLE